MRWWKGLHEETTATPRVLRIALVTALALGGQGACSRAAWAREGDAAGEARVAVASVDEDADSPAAAAALTEAAVPDDTTGDGEAAAPDDETPLPTEDVPAAGDQDMPAAGNQDMPAAGNQDTQAQPLETQLAQEAPLPEGPTEAANAQAEADEDDTSALAPSTEPEATGPVDSPMMAGESVSPQVATPALAAEPRRAADDSTSETPAEEPVPEEEPAPPANGWWTDPKDGTKTYFYKNGVRQRGWVVTNLGTADNKKGTSRRYWIDANYELARGRVVNPASTRDKLSGAYLAYARDDGAIATGVFTVGDRVYLANASGKLGGLKGSKKRGWLVTKAYDGKKRRYYLYRSTSGADAGACYARLGFSRDGYAHYTLAKGYVLTGTKKVKGRIYLATKKGKLAAPKKDKAKGWLVSSAFSKGSTKRRYYLYRATDGAYPGAYYAKKGYSADGYRHYTKSSGYVVTGVWKTKGRVYVASAKGKLAALKGGKAKGWLTSSAYGQGKQRYYLYRSKSGVSKGAYYAKPGYSTDGYRHYTTKQGYVLRNTDLQYGGKWYKANDKGRLKRVQLPTYLKKAWDLSSPSSYLLVVDNGHSHVYVLKGSKGKWKLSRDFTASCGKPSTPTVKGTFHVGSRGYSFGSGYTCYYWTQFYEDYLFHSVLYNEGTRTVQDGTLGSNASHGCVRLAIENAKWIYDSIPSDTTVLSY